VQNVQRAVASMIAQVRRRRSRLGIANHRPVVPHLIDDAELLG